MNACDRNRIPIIPKMIPQYCIFIQKILWLGLNSTSCPVSLSIITRPFSPFHFLPINQLNAAATKKPTPIDASDWPLGNITPTTITLANNTIIERNPLPDHTIIFIKFNCAYSHILCPFSAWSDLIFSVIN